MEYWLQYVSSLSIQHTRNSGRDELVLNSQSKHCSSWVHKGNLTPDTDISSKLLNIALSTTSLGWLCLPLSLQLVISSGFYSSELFTAPIQNCLNLVVRVCWHRLELRCIFPIQISTQLNHRSAPWTRRINSLEKVQKYSSENVCST